MTDNFADRGRRAVKAYEDIGWRLLGAADHPEDLPVCAKAAEVANAAYGAGRCLA